MHHEFLKYIPDASSELLQLIDSEWLQTEAVDTNELCEEIWLTQDREDAVWMLEAYADIISDYSYRLLHDIIFGPDIN